ncbi:MAG: hypothetical protein QM731_01050 [Chitinophagaceae bacterium]
MNKILLFVALLSIITSCKQQPSKADTEALAAVETIDSSKGDFDPAKQVSMQSAHWAITGKYTAGSYQFDTTAFHIRSGRLPYAQESKPSLPFVVSYYDVSGKLIGQYSIENPVNLKSCEPGKEGSKITDMDFEILLPANTAISNIQIDISGKKAGTFRLPARRVVDTGGERNPNDTTRIPGARDTSVIKP